MFSKAGFTSSKRAPPPTAGTLGPTDSRTTSPPAEAPAAAGLAPKVTYRSLASDTTDTEQRAQRRLSRNLCVERSRAHHARVRARVHTRTRATRARLPRAHARARTRTRSHACRDHLTCMSGSAGISPHARACGHQHVFRQLLPVRTGAHARAHMHGEISLCQLAGW